MYNVVCYTNTIYIELTIALTQLPANYLVTKITCI